MCKTQPKIPEQLGDLVSYDTEHQCPRCAEKYGVRVSGTVKHHSIMREADLGTDSYTTIHGVRIEPTYIEDQERMNKLRAEEEPETPKNP